MPRKYASHTKHSLSKSLEKTLIQGIDEVYFTNDDTTVSFEDSDANSPSTELQSQRKCRSHVAHSSMSGKKAELGMRHENINSDFFVAKRLFCEESRSSQNSKASQKMEKKPSRIEGVNRQRSKEFPCKFTAASVSTRPPSSSTLDELSSANSFASENNQVGAQSLKNSNQMTSLPETEEGLGESLKDVTKSKSLVTNEDSAVETTVSVNAQNTVETFKLINTRSSLAKGRNPDLLCLRLVAKGPDACLHRGHDATLSKGPNVSLRKGHNPLLLHMHRSVPNALNHPMFA